MITVLLADTVRFYRGAGIFVFQFREVNSPFDMMSRLAKQEPLNKTYAVL